jgi:hypothetical protein
MRRELFAGICVKMLSNAAVVMYARSLRGGYTQSDVMFLGFLYIIHIALSQSMFVILFGKAGLRLKPADEVVRALAQIPPVLSLVHIGGASRVFRYASWSCDEVRLDMSGTEAFAVCYLDLDVQVQCADEKTSAALATLVQWMKDAGAASHFRESELADVGPVVLCATGRGEPPALLRPSVYWLACALLLDVPYVVWLGRVVCHRKLVVRDTVRV